MSCSLLRPVFTLALGLICLTGSLAAAETAAAPSDSRRPNVLFIVSDDQGWGDYGFMGHAHIATPHLDQLARESITFQRGYTPVPLCRPSLATMLTGLYPHQHGVTGNDPTLPGKVSGQTGRQKPEFAKYYNTIIEHFRQRPNVVRDLTSQGYVALQTGKWWEGNPLEVAGFTHAMTVGTGKGDRHGGKGLEIGREGIAPVTAFIAAAGEAPFFVWYAPMLPHAPHTPPAELLEKYLPLAPTEAVAKYWACVEWFDRGCGELLDYLEQHQLRDNTIVIYVTDNGWIQNPEQANRFAPRSKLTPFEGGVRTPIMVSWRGKLEPRMDTEHLASSIDLWPTLAALLRTDTPDNLPGINLTDAQAVAARKRVFGEQYTHNIADVEQFTDSLEHRTIIDGWFKLIVPTASVSSGNATGPQLFNLQDDPWEEHDLAAAHPDKVQSMTATLNAWWQPE